MYYCSIGHSPFYNLIILTPLSCMLFYFVCYPETLIVLCQLTGSLLMRLYCVASSYVLPGYWVDEFYMMCRLVLTIYHLP